MTNRRKRKKRRNGEWMPGDKEIKYLPTPDEIKRMTALIREDWPEERLNRPQFWICPGTERLVMMPSDEQTKLNRRINARRKKTEATGEGRPYQNDNSKE